ncbi:MAG: hypothetical protein PHE88_11760 [Elusimicrobia bacterium]|nr:hypothetical protein [Elusimicrobiota bacterium]
MKWHKDKQPKESGWYIRDYRGVDCGKDAPPFSVDEFVTNEDGSFWYVCELDMNIGIYNMNDARFDNLPWAKIKDYK